MDYITRDVETLLIIDFHHCQPQILSNTEERTALVLIDVPRISFDLITDLAVIVGKKKNKKKKQVVFYIA